MQLSAQHSIVRPVRSRSVANNVQRLFSKNLLSLRRAISESLCELIKELQEGVFQTPILGLSSSGLMAKG